MRDSPARPHCFLLGGGSEVELTKHGCCLQTVEAERKKKAEKRVHCARVVGHQRMESHHNRCSSHRQNSRPRPRQETRSLEAQSTKRLQWRLGEIE